MEASTLLIDPEMMLGQLKWTWTIESSQLDLPSTMSVAQDIAIAEDEVPNEAADMQIFQKSA